MANTAKVIRTPTQSGNTKKIFRPNPDSKYPRWNVDYMQFDEHDPGPPRDAEGKILTPLLARCTKIRGRVMPSVLNEDRGPRERAANKKFV